MLTVDLKQTIEFFSQAYPTTPWPGVINFEVYKRWIEPDGKKKTKYVTRFPISSAEQIETIDPVAFNLLQNEGYHLYFTCAFMQASGQSRKQDVVGLSFLWADVDHVDEEEMQARLKNCPVWPSGVVRSGDGYHIYWRLSEILEPGPDVEAGLIRVRDWVNAPKGTTNINRLLRIPGTFNCKSEYGEPRQCSLQWWNAARIYALSDFTRANITFAEIRVAEDFKTKYILHGEFIGDNEDRSTRDYAVIKELLRAGHTAAEITEIFTNTDFKCSDKAIERPDYLKLSIDQATKELGAIGKAGTLYDDNNCVFKQRIMPNGMPITEQISNFTITPKRYVNMVNEGTKLVECVVAHKSFVSEIMFDAEELAMSLPAIRKIGFPGASWQGSHIDWSTYLRGIIEKELPEEYATDVVGWCQESFVLPHKTLFNQKVRYITRTASPPLFSTELESPEFSPTAHLQKIHDSAKALRPAVALPVLGWYLAAAFAPQVREAYIHQFPLMALEGNPGSGKTTIAMLLREVLYGTRNYISRASTTAQIRNSLAGSNAVPVFLDEYEHHKADFKTESVNELFRISFQAGYTQRTGDKGVSDSFQLAAPCLFTTTRGIVDEALNDRAYTVRCKPIQKNNADTMAEYALATLEGLPRTTQFLEWWLQQPREWIVDIKQLCKAVDGTPRQRLAFAVPAACLLWCSKQYNWGITLEECVAWFTGSSVVKFVMEPIDAIETALVNLVNKRMLLANMHFKVVKNVMSISSAVLVDSMLEAPNLDTGYELTRKWILKTLTQGIESGHVIQKGDKLTYPISIGGVLQRCIILNLDHFPELSQHVYKYDENAGFT